MIFIRPEPQRHTIDLDEYLTTIDTQTETITNILTTYWNNPDIHAAITPIDSATQICASLARRASWTWHTTEPPVTNRKFSRCIVKITIWTNDDITYGSPIYLTAHLALTRYRNETTSIRSTAPGKMIIGSPTDYKITTYVGEAIGELAAMALPTLARDAYITTATNAVPAWHINAPATFSALIQALPTLTPIDMPTMTSMIQILARVITDQDLAAMIIEALPLELAAEESSCETISDTVATWCTTNGSPDTYIQDIITPILNDQRPLVDAIRTTVELMDSCHNYTKYENGRVPEINDVLVDWNYANINRIQLPRIRKYAFTLATETANVITTKYPELTATDASSRHTTPITWTKAQEIAKETDTIVVRKHNYIYFSLRSQADAISRVRDQLQLWPFNWQADKITALTHLRFPYHVTDTPCVA